MADNPYSLKNLDSYISSQEMIRKAMAKVETAKQAYRDKYGAEEGERRYRADRADASRKAIRRMVNERIYLFGANSEFLNRFSCDASRKRYEDRFRALCGDQYDEIAAYRTEEDPRVAELMIQEALQTGVWDELPDVLQVEYWKRVKCNGGDVAL